MVLNVLHWAVRIVMSKRKMDNHFPCNKTEQMSNKVGGLFAPTGTMYLIFIGNRLITLPETNIFALENG